MPAKARQETDIEARIRADLRAIRIDAAITQDEMAELVGMERSFFNKIESGAVRIKLTDYLVFMDYLRYIVPDHPGVALARMFLRPGRK